MVATIARDKINTFIATARLTDETRSSICDWLAFWKEQYRQLDELTPLAERSSENQRKSQLKLAVSGHTELQAIDDKEKMRVVTGESALTYAQYLLLLESRAVTLDTAQRMKANNHARARRSVNNTDLQVHEMSIDEFEAYVDPYADVWESVPTQFHSLRIDDTTGADPSDATMLQFELYLTEAGTHEPIFHTLTYDNDTGFSLYQVDKNNEYVEIPFIPKQHWDMLPDDVKAAILKHQRQNPNRRRTPRFSSGRGVPGRTSPGRGRSPGFARRTPAASGRGSPPPQPAASSGVPAVRFAIPREREKPKPTVHNTNVTPAEDVPPDTYDDDPRTSATIMSHIMGTGSQQRSPTDLRSIMSTSATARDQSTSSHHSTTPPSSSRPAWQMNEHNVTYHVANHDTTVSGALVDRGANGSLAGSDVRLIEFDAFRFADITGINDTEVKGLKIATVAAVTTTQAGPVVLIIHQAAYMGKGKTIFSSAQMEHFRTTVNDRCCTLGGAQNLVTLDGYVIPLQVRNGLPYVDIHPPTDEELHTLPHVVLTSDEVWDPRVLDHEFNLQDPTSWSDTMLDDLVDADHPIDPRYDATGSFVDVIVNEHDMASIRQARQDAPGFTIKDKPPDYEAAKPCLGWAPMDIIKRTFLATTQRAKNLFRVPMRKHFRARWPAFNVPRRDEPVATDSIFSDTPAHNGGEVAAQLYVGTKSLVGDLEPMRAETDIAFVRTLEDNIRKRGAMAKLISDRAANETSRKTQDILRGYGIQDWQSEPHHQHQNFAENYWQTLKNKINLVMERTGCPSSYWLYCALWILLIMNHLAHPSLNWRTPMERHTGSTPDISPLLVFPFYHPVFYRVHDGTFPSDGTERKGRFVGVATSVGDAMTYKIVDDETNKLLYRSSVRSAVDSKAPNRRLLDLDGEGSKPVKEFVKLGQSRSPKVFDPDEMSELIGRTYLTDTDEQGNKYRARIVRCIEEFDEELAQSRRKYLVKFDHADKEDEIIAHDDILRFINKQYPSDYPDTTDDDEETNIWKFKRLSAHQGPLPATHPDYKGCPFNVQVEWEDGSITYEPLSVIAADDPVSCAIYARDNDLLHLPGWRRFKFIVRNQKKLKRMLNQAKLQSFRRGPIYKYGFRIPRNYKEAMYLDKLNGNTRWFDAVTLERTQLLDYSTFKDLGYAAKAPEGYKRIRCHFIFDVKHDGRHKARLVAGGHLTEVPLESIYSGVVSLRSVRIVLFLAELNGLDLFAADIGNAYLEARTKERIYFVADDSFGEELAGHTLVIVKALYGLRSSGARWHERFADTLRDMQFFPCKADPDVWMRRNEDVYEYVAVYVDDLLIAAKNPKEITDTLMNKYKYKLKGVGKLVYHLGMDFGRDPDGTLHFGPKKYIERMLNSYKTQFGELPKVYHTPIERGDHPEMDTTEFLDDNGTRQYQSLIGAAQWLVTLARLDIATAVMTLSRFRAEPRVGHMQRLKRLFGYVRKFPHGLIRVRTEEPDYSQVPIVDHDWTYSVYGKVTEAMPDDAPEPLGKYVTTTTFVDANLYHCLVTGRATTGILHMVNKTLLAWFSKRQATVETATYGSEFVAARQATEQIIDLRLTLRYFGVPVRTRSYMFGDNQSVITSSTIPQSALGKRHIALSYHRVREAIAAKILAFIHIDGKENPADTLSKFCNGTDLHHHIRPLLFWMGDTANIPDALPHNQQNTNDKEKLD